MCKKNRNLLAIKLLSTFSSELDQNYLTLGKHKRFIPYPGDRLAYKMHRNFPAYHTNSVIISVIAYISEAIEYLLP